MSDTAACCDHSGWQRTMGEEQRQCPETTVMPRGAKNVEAICEDAWNMGIKYLTVYAVFHGKLEALQGRGGRRS